MIKEVKYYIACCDRCGKEANIEPNQDEDVALGLAIDECKFSIKEDESVFCEDCSLLID